MEDRSEQRPCPAYTTPRLAAVYDALNPFDDDRFYLRFAGDRPLSILDAGCGTGRLACAFAARGHHVTGLDPARAMLALARQRPGGDRIDWIEGDAAALPRDRTYDLAVMTGHVFQVFLTDQAALATLSAIRARLAPGGRFAFETRNPIARKWLTWTPAETAATVAIPGEGSVNVHYDMVGERDGTVTYDTYFAFADGEQVVARSWLRFRAHDHVASLLDQAGLTVRELYGDRNAAPFKEQTSPEIIIVAQAGN